MNDRLLAENHGGVDGAGDVEVWAICLLGGAVNCNFEDGVPVVGVPGRYVIPLAWGPAESDSGCSWCVLGGGLAWAEG
jgi:hypothetical protein